MPWDHGTGTDDNGSPIEYEVLGYQTEQGARIDGVPSGGLIRNDAVTGVLVAIYPEGDAEASRHFWVHGHGVVNRSPADWIRHIKIAAKRYKIQLTPGTPVQPPGGGGGGPIKPPPIGPPEPPEPPRKPRLPKPKPRFVPRLPRFVKRIFGRGK